MLTRALYRFYGLVTRLPGFGPRFDRWVRAHRGWAYRLRDVMLRIERRFAGGVSDSAVHGGGAALTDLAWMVAGLRDAVRRLQEQVEANTGIDELLEKHRHALNVKVDAAVEALTLRVERAERALGQATVQASAPAAVTRILAPQKLAFQLSRPQGLWLELGCGDKPDPERVNVDQRLLPGVDIVASVHSLPLPDDCVTDLRAAHLVEHFTHRHFCDGVLPEWRRVLAPGGVLRLITPDLGAMLRAYWDGRLAEHDLVHVLYGGQDYAGDFHYHAYSVDSLVATLRAAGFGRIEVVAQGRPNGLCLECEVLAYKPCAGGCPDLAAPSVSSTGTGPVNGTAPSASCSPTT